MKQVVVVSGARTPFGRFGGALSTIGATDLGAHVIKAAVNKAAIDRITVDQCIMGMVLPCGYGQNPAKQAAIKAELSQDVDGLTINKVCGSGLKAVMLGAQAIQCGDAEIVVAGGMENMSMAPYFLRGARWGHRMGHGQLEDHMVYDGLWDVVNDFHMGLSNELISGKWRVSREEQDRYAEESYHKAIVAMENGYFNEEIVSISVPRRNRENHFFDTDECVQETSIEKLQQLEPAFDYNGVGTAGNASKISDGAAAVVLMSRQKARELGCEVMAELGAQASSGIELKYVLMAPINAIPKVLGKEGIELDTIDLFEINEAFSGSSIAINRTLGLDTAKVNVNGGCVAIGHPIGASGARLLVTMLYEMKRRQSKRGIISLCLGGGEAVAVIVKKASEE